MGKGKIAAQVAHASLGAYEKCDERTKKEWKDNGWKKIVLKVSSKEELMNLYEKAEKAKLPCFLVRDAGLTQLPPGVITALAIGPAEEKRVDEITGKLKLL